ncbi:MAG: hypothetical protein AAFW67_12310, partial [Cyanobacteria bacterium J06638_38]
EHVNEFGIPIVQKNLIEINKENKRGYLFDCHRPDLCAVICALTGASLGLPIELTSEIIVDSLMDV